MSSDQFTSSPSEPRTLRQEIPFLIGVTTLVLVGFSAYDSFRFSQSILGRKQVAIAQFKQVKDVFVPVSFRYPDDGPLYSAKIVRPAWQARDLRTAQIKCTVRIGMHIIEGKYVKPYGPVLKSLMFLARWEDNGDSEFVAQIDPDKIVGCGEPVMRRPLQSSRLERG